MSKFIFDNISQVNYNKSNDKYKKTVFKYTKLFSFDNDSLKSLYNNYRPSYKKLAEKNIKHDQIFEIEQYNNDYITLDNSFVNNNGVIFTSNKEIFINGGCLCGNTSFSFKKNIIMVNNVISITSMWSDGIWHFPFESFVSLMSIPEDILHKSKIHVAKISNYIIQWFEFLNIPVSQLITGDIFAKTLYLPRMGKCGNPYYSQINWLKDIVSAKTHKRVGDSELIVDKDYVGKKIPYLQNIGRIKRLGVITLDDYIKLTEAYTYNGGNLVVMINKYDDEVFQEQKYLKTASKKTVGRVLTSNTAIETENLTGGNTYNYFPNCNFYIDSKVGAISGTVVNVYGEPVAYANITLVGNKKTFGFVEAFYMKPINTLLDQSQLNYLMEAMNLILFFLKMN